MAASLAASARPSTAPAQPGPPRPVSATGKVAPLGRSAIAAPSVARIAALAQCMRIRETFAQRRQHISAAVLERAVTVPDDRAPEECRALLPRPGSWIVDPVAPPPKKTGKAGKKGKKGKKKGKKAK
jgi:hypothetical protein